MLIEVALCINVSPVIVAITFIVAANAPEMFALAESILLGVTLIVDSTVNVADETNPTSTFTPGELPPLSGCSNPNSLFIVQTNCLILTTSMFIPVVLFMVASPNCIASSSVAVKLAKLPPGIK